MLLQSAAFDSPKACGEQVAALKAARHVTDETLLAEGVDTPSADAALARLVAAELARKDAKA